MAGAIVWEGDSLLTGDPIVVVATWDSKNPKTGNMVQMYILLADVEPHIAVKSGEDAAVCGNCPQRPSVGGSCYVKTFQAPLSIYRAYKRGSYNRIISYDKLQGKPIRFGSYGDPAAVPYEVWAEVIDNIKPSMTTGYTHQMNDRSFDRRMAGINMISVETPKMALKAHGLGFRTFRVTSDTDQVLPNEIICPNDTSGVQCVDCGLCDGAGDKPSIVIQVHGALASRYVTKYDKINVVNL